MTGRNSPEIRFEKEGAPPEQKQAPEAKEKETAGPAGRTIFRPEGAGKFFFTVIYRSSCVRGDGWLVRKPAALQP
jgi:hypothetical protein